jgi:two-component system, OmpR family, phosphate regulon sensor histidine kinase PhoR
MVFARIPAGGFVVAAVTAVSMLVAGVDWLVVAAVLAVWCASFWLAQPPPQEAPVPRGDAMQMTQAGMAELLESAGLPMLMLDGERIILANKAAREALGAHVIGQDARVAFRHPEAVELLARRSGGSADIEGLTGPRSIWHVQHHLIDQRYSLVELLNRTAEADISRAHTDFVANASHELRTPLASIIGYMETLADEGTDMPPAQAEKFYATVLREARRLASLVDDLMSLSRVEAEKHDQPRETVDLVQLVRQAARDGAGPERLKRLKFELAAESLPVRGDRNQLEQLVRNLVDNAMKYGAADSDVTVCIDTTPAGLARLAVRDRGDGIAAEHIPHLTRRFYRTDPSRSRAQGGTGLGLAIVKHIVERHRGQLDIESRVGQGTTVTVRLPVVAESEA